MKLHNVWLLPMLWLVIFVTGCASTKQPEPLPPVCPEPPQLPALKKLPANVTGPSFLERLELRMWTKPSALTRSESSYSIATPSTTQPGTSSLGLK